MFSVYFYVGIDFIVNGTMQYLPRQGEKVSINGKMYKVEDVAYLIESGTSSTTEVVIRMEGNK